MSTQESLNKLTINELTDLFSSSTNELSDLKINSYNVEEEEACQKLVSVIQNVIWDKMKQ